MFEDLSLVRVGLGVVIVMVLGMLWYSPKLFGNLWAEGYEFKPDDLNPTAIHFIGAICVAILTSLGMHFFIKVSNPSSVLEACTYTFWIWLGLIASSQFSGVVWAGKTFTVFLIDAFGILVSLEALALLFAL